MAHDLKTDQNTPVDDINTITNPNTKTLVDRYVFASNFCKGKKVLDCASGYGYGSLILNALGAEKVNGLDIDWNAVEYARKKIDGNGLNKNIDFDTIDITQPTNLPHNDYDVVISIETFEHVPRETVKQMLTNFKNLCKPGGTILITTPIRHTPKFNYIDGSTHLYEYSVNEFVQEISSVFNTFELWYAIEFRHSVSEELNTVFTKDHQYASNSAVQIAVITND
jgi:2-polyprenyl-3-methyl-5-hydroxy-6-metoxy-1,4-benzoquinol methylase